MKDGRGHEGTELPSAEEWGRGSKWRKVELMDKPL